MKGFTTLEIIVFVALALLAYTFVVPLIWAATWIVIRIVEAIVFGVIAFYVLRWILVR